MPAYVLVPCEDKDFTNGSTELVDTIFDAFGTARPLINSMHPNNTIPSGRQKALKMLHAFSKAPTQRWVKILETNTFATEVLPEESTAASKVANTDVDGKIVAVGQWAVYANGNKPVVAPINGPPDNWDTEDDKAWCQALTKSLMERRVNYISPNAKSVVCLTKLAVAPEHQRRGLGKSLMQHAIEEADSLEAEVTVESTVEGKGLYEEFGFAEMETITFRVPERFSDRPKETLCIMKRTANSAKPATK